MTKKIHKKEIITEAQYESLFTFCRKHYVRYYDVQLELIDHLTEAIEAKMTSYPTLTFDNALEEVYKGFGIKGFADIVASKIEVVRKQSRREKWKLFFSYFTLPKIVMTLSIYLGILLVTQVVNNAIFKQTTLLGIAVTLVIFEIFSLLKTARLFKSQQKEMLYTNEKLTTILQSGLLLQLIFSSRLLELIENDNLSEISYGLISFILVVIFIAILAQRQFAKKLYQNAKKQYPGAFAN